MENLGPQHFCVSFRNQLVNFYKLILKFIWKCKELRISKTILKEKKKMVDLSNLISMKAYSKTTVIKTGTRISI